MDRPTKWTPISVGFFRDPKIMVASPSAKLLYLAALCWSQETESGGRVPKNGVKILAAEAGTNTRAADELGDLGLWIDDGDAWLIAGWENWNIPAQEIQKRREQARERQRKRRSVTRDTSVTGSAVSRVTSRYVTPTDEEEDEERENNYQSSVVTTGAVDNSDGDDGIAIAAHQAALKLADIEAETHGDVVNLDGWRRTRKPKILERYSDMWLAHLSAHPNATADDLVRQVTTSAQAPPRPYCAVCESSGWTLDDSGDAHRCECETA